MNSKNSEFFSITDDFNLSTDNSYGTRGIATGDIDSPTRDEFDNLQPIFNTNIDVDYLINSNEDDDDDDDDTKSNNHHGKRKISDTETQQSNGIFKIYNIFKKFSLFNIFLSQFLYYYNLLISNLRFRFTM